jgi:hypothetical protein
VTATSCRLNTDVRADYACAAGKVLQPDGDGKPSTVAVRKDYGTSSRPGLSHVPLAVVPRASTGCCISQPGDELVASVLKQTELSDCPACQNKVGVLAPFVGIFENQNRYLFVATPEGVCAPIARSSGGSIAQRLLVTA